MAVFHAVYNFETHWEPIYQIHKNYNNKYYTVSNFIPHIHCQSMIYHIFSIICFIPSLDIIFIYVQGRQGTVAFLSLLLTGVIITHYRVTKVANRCFKINFIKSLLRQIAQKEFMKQQPQGGYGFNLPPPTPTPRHLLNKFLKIDSGF